MKNKLTLLFFGAFFLLLGFTSCSKDNDGSEKEPVIETTVFNQPVLSFSDSEVTVDGEQADATAISFSWTAADNDLDISTMYTVYMNIEGKDIFEGYSKKIGNELEYSLTHSQLASMLLDDFDVTGGESAKLEVVVVAEDMDGMVESSVSKTKDFTVTLLESGPEALYLVGAAYDDSWDISSAAKLTEIESGVYEAEGVTLRFGAPADKKGLKLLLSNQEWYPFYSQNVDSETFGELSRFTEDDPDSQLFPLEHGYESAIYTVTANLNTMQFSLTKTGDLESESGPEALYLVGGAYDESWDISNAARLTEVEPGVYEAENLTLSFGATTDKKGLKLLTSNEEWYPFYSQNLNSETFGELSRFTEEDPDSQLYPLEDGYESAIYTVTANLNTMQFSLTKTGDLESEVDYSQAIFMLGDATPFGWEFSEGNAMTETSNGVYEYSEVELTAEESQGFKFFVGINSWDDYYGRKDPNNLDPYWTVKLRGESEPDAQYYLNQAGVSAGTYKVVLDTNEMTLEMTPVD